MFKRKMDHIIDSLTVLKMFKRNYKCSNIYFNILSSTFQYFPEPILCTCNLCFCVKHLHVINTLAQKPILRILLNQKYVLVFFHSGEEVNTRVVG